MKLTIKEIYEILNSKYPIELQEEWDNCGLLYNNFESELLTNALISLDINELTIKFAIENDCNLIVSHHPLYIEPNDSKKPLVKKLLKRLQENQISVISFHTNFDKHKNGMNYQLAKKLKLKNIKKHHKSVFLVTGELEQPKSIEETKALVMKSLELPSMTYSQQFNKNKLIKKIAIGGGGCSGELPLLSKKENIDLTITSEVKWHQWNHTISFPYIISEVPHSVEKIFIETIANFLKTKEVLDVVEYPYELINKTIFFH